MLRRLKDDPADAASFSQEAQVPAARDEPLEEQVTSVTIPPEGEEKMERIPEPGEPEETVPDIDYFDAADNYPGRRRPSWTAGIRGPGSDKPVTDEELADDVAMLQDII